MSVTNIKSDKEFQKLLISAQNLLVVDFSASWCGPCKRIMPIFEQMSEKYPQAEFAKLDVDLCEETAISQGITAMPTFIFFKNSEKIDQVSGANPQILEERIKLHYNLELSDSSPVKGHIDLEPYIIKTQFEALNEVNDHPLINCFTDNESYLESDCDNQLIIPITFSQAVKLHSIVIKAPENVGPKTIKLFINQPKVLDFDGATSYIPVQSIEVSPADLSLGKPIGLNFVKFQNIYNIQLFVENNHDNSDTTRIDRLQLFGTPVVTTNMKNFKRVAGKHREVDH